MGQETKRSSRWMRRTSTRHRSGDCGWKPDTCVVSSVGCRESRCDATFQAGFRHHETPLEHVAVEGKRFEECWLWGFGNFQFGAMGLKIAKPTRGKRLDVAILISRSSFIGARARPKYVFLEVPRAAGKLLDNIGDPSRPSSWTPILARPNPPLTFINKTLCSGTYRPTANVFNPKLEV